jgi:hypothetical protein
MAKLANENWIYDDENTSHAKKAVDVLRKAKSTRMGKKYIRVVICEQPLTIIEKEDPSGQCLYGKKRR